jgi:hypothetical protein
MNSLPRRERTKPPVRPIAYGTSEIASERTADRSLRMRSLTPFEPSEPRAPVSGRGECRAGPSLCGGA